MKVCDFIISLANFASIAPGNGDAEVMLSLGFPMVCPFQDAHLAEGVNSRMLILLASPATAFEIRNVSLQ